MKKLKYKDLYFINIIKMVLEENNKICETFIVIFI